MARAITLKDYTTDEVVYPQTLIDLVQDSDGTTVRTLIDNKQSKISASGILVGDGSGNVKGVDALVLKQASGSNDVYVMNSPDDAKVIGRYYDNFSYFGPDEDGCGIIASRDSSSDSVLLFTAGGNSAVSFSSDTDGNVKLQLFGLDSGVPITGVAAPITDDGATNKQYVDDVADGKQDTITGAASTIASADLTAKRALVSNSSGKVGVASTTLQELNYLHGVTSAVQAQLDGKQDKITANGFLRGDGAGNVIADKPVYIVSPIFIGTETAIISSDDTVISIYEKLAAGYDVILRENVVSVSSVTARQFICQGYQKLTRANVYNIWFYDVSSSGVTILFGSAHLNDSASAESMKTLTVSTQEFGTEPSATLSTLTAAGWDNGVQTVAVTGLLAASNGTLAIAQSATDEQWEAWSAAAVRATAQANGSLTLQAMGDVPTVDIPVEVIIL